MRQMVRSVVSMIIVVVLLLSVFMTVLVQGGGVIEILAG